MNHFRRGVPVALRPMHEPSLADPLALLDSTRERLLRGADPVQATDILSDGLWWLHQKSTSGAWREFAAVARAHPLMGLLHENPLMRRAFVKPRGFAGDAPLLDLVYYGRAAAEARDASPLGLALLDRDFSTPTMAAMRERRDFTAALIDHVCEIAPMPSILLPSCGHLREGLISEAVQQHRLGRLVALDRDPEALAVVTRDLAFLGVETMQHGTRALLERGFAPGSFDLITTGALYEYLTDPVAVVLTRRFFELLKPGGRLVIGNLVPGLYDIGQIEAFCDWTMVYRDAGGMLALAGAIDDDEVALKRVYTRLSPDICYLELRKRCIIEAPLPWARCAVSTRVSL